MKVIRARVTIVSAALVVAASVTYVHAAAKVTMPSVVAKVTIKPRLIYRFVDPLTSQDSFDMSDDKSFNMTKIRADVVANTDRINYKNMTKVLADGFAVHDDFRSTNVKPIDLNTATGTVDPDPITMGEIVRLSLSRPNITDNTQITDAVTLKPTLLRSDSVVVFESNAKTITKVLADSLVVSDSISTLNVPTRTFQDNPAMTDVATLYVQEGTYHAFNEYALNKANIN